MRPENDEAMELADMMGTTCMTIMIHDNSISDDRIDQGYCDNERHSTSRHEEEYGEEIVIARPRNRQAHKRDSPCRRLEEPSTWRVMAEHLFH